VTLVIRLVSARSEIFTNHVCVIAFFLVLNAKCSGIVFCRTKWLAVFRGVSLWSVVLRWEVFGRFSKVNKKE